ncbi:MAG: MFS transporter [Rubricoccaceae bacterium]|nr:MFS transporter [Rubricoccaceae bacterium]
MVFTAASQTIIVTPILPIIGDALNVPEARWGRLITVYSIALAVAALVMGPVSDRIGRRRILLIGSGSLTIALALHGLVSSFESLLAARALAGACGGVLSGAAVAYVGDYFPYERRGWATGLVMSGIPFGLVIGVPLGRVLAAGLGFLTPFLSFAALMGVAFVLILLVVPQPDVDSEKSRMTFRGTVAGYGRLIVKPDVLVASLTYFLMYLGLSLLVVYLPEWLTAQFALEITIFGRPLTMFGLDIDLIAAVFLVGGFAGVFAGPIAGSVSDTMGRKPLILASCIGLVIVTLALTYVVTERWLAYPAYILIMMLFAMRMSPLQALLTAIVPAHQRGSFMSLTIAIGQTGTAIGAFVAGFLYAGAGYRTTTFASAATVLVLAVLVWRFLPEPTEDAVRVPEEVPTIPGAGG